MMIQDLGEKFYHVEYTKKEPKDEDTVLVYNGNTVLANYVEDVIKYPTKQELQHLELNYTYLFCIDDREYYLGRLPGQEDVKWPEGYEFQGISIFRTGSPKEEAFASVTGLHMSVWYEKNQFCGVCGKPMVHDDKERMMRCPACGNMNFPQICPAVIVAVVHEGKILLTKYAGRNYTKYALIAGFNEIGESIEATVEREVLEEVGLKVKNITYYGSQPWGLTSTMLMGFFCELDGENESIRLDETELAMAGFFSPEEIPESDEHVSLTREMMNVFKAGKMPALTGSNRIDI